jgi:predicted O-methyltransferase YrrM
MNSYENKLDEFLFKEIKDLKNINILEFGVRFGVSTKKFIDLVEKNGGHVYSVDLEDCSHISKSSQWSFIKSRDDNFKYIEKKIPKKFDIIYYDSFHDALHMKKILYYYYNRLKVNGLYIIDDVSHLPYLKDKKRNSFNCEINNRETFYKILEIFNSNINNLKLYFSFHDSGLAKIKKITNQSLKPEKKINTRVITFKNIIRKIYRKFFNN